MVMRRKIIIISLLCFSFCSSFAQAPLRTFTFDNNSRCPVYVYVTTAKKVYVPQVVQTPYKVVAIPSHATRKVNFEYHLDWDDQTRLSFRFCTDSSQSCVSNVGEYTGFTISPDPNSISVSRWRLRADRLWILWPYPISDNIYQLDGTVWNRDRTVPFKVTFKDAFSSRSARRALKCPGQ